MARDARMNTDRKPAWLRLGTPAAVSVLLGVVAGIWVSRATEARPGLSAVLGAVATVAAWALWEAWLAVRDARRDDGPTGAVTQTAKRVHCRLIGWTGPLATRLPGRIRQEIGTIEPGGQVIGADVRGETTGTLPPG